MTKPQIRVLLVDDDLVDRMACRRALAQNPEYEFVLNEAETGREGLQLAHAQKPDCVLLDYQLPDLNGLEFLAELRNDPGEIPVPVMMLTGTNNTSVAVEAMKRGAQDYLVKDENRQYLQLLPAVIQRVLRERRMLIEKKQAEQKLKDLSDRLQHILASTPAIHYACRIDGEHFVPAYASPNLKGAWGYDPKEYLGNAEWWWSGIHPEGRDSVIGTFRAALAAADCSHYAHEYRFRRKDGSYRWVHDELQIIRDQAGQPLEFVGSWLDITERKRTEDTLRDSRESLNRLLNSIVEGAYGVDTDGNCIFVNPSCLHMLGYQNQDELLGKHMHTLMHHSHADGSPYPVSECRIYRAYQSLEVTHVTDDMFWRKDGSSFPVEYWSNPILVDGVAIGAILTFVDITERKRAEELLRKSSKEIEDLYNHAPCGYHSLDKDGIIRRINDTELAWLGYTRDEVVGKMKWPDLVTPAGLQAFRGTFPQLKKLGFVHDLEVEIIRKDGTVFIGLINAASTYDSCGNYVMSRSTVADITERKQMERQLRNLAAHLQIVREEEKTGIAREVHDDLGGTLTALKMEVYWLADELLANKEAASLLEHTRLISQLADNATNAMRRVITDLRPSVLDDLGLPAALEWQAAQFHQRTGIECWVNCVGTERGEGKLDRIQSINLFRIFQEAITNASRHSFASRVEVEFICNDDEVMLSVSDNGRGMPENHAVAPTSFGLLGITERAEQLGGRIKFGNSPNGGFSVTVMLPSRRRQKREKA